MAAPSFVAASGLAGATATATLPVPAGTAAGDIVIVTGGIVFSGHTLVANNAVAPEWKHVNFQQLSNHSSHTLWRRVTAADVAAGSWTFTFTSGNSAYNGNQGWALGCAVYRNARDVYLAGPASATNVDGGGLTPPGITAENVGLLVIAASGTGGGTPTFGSGFTSRKVVADWPTVAIGDKATVAGALASGTVNATGSQGNVATAMVLEPLTTEPADTGLLVSRAATASSATHGKTVTVTLPAGIAINDVMIATASAWGLADAPAGWTSLGTQATDGQLQTRMFWKRVTAGDMSGDGTFTMTVPGTFDAGMLVDFAAFRGVNDPTFYMAANGFSVTPYVPTTTGGLLLLAGHGITIASDFHPTLQSQVYSDASRNIYTYGNVQGFLAYAPLVAGKTVSPSWWTNQTANGCNTMTALVTPKVGPSGSLAASLPRFSTLTTGKVSLGGMLAATLPKFSAATTARYDSHSIGSLTPTLPRFSASLTGTRELPPRSAELRVALPKFSATSASIIENEGLRAFLPAFSSTLNAYAVPTSYTDRTYGNDGYSYGGVAEAAFDPAVASAPPALTRNDVRRIHVALPTPTLVNGRPQ